MVLHAYFFASGFLYGGRLVFKIYVIPTKALREKRSTTRKEDKKLVQFRQIDTKRVSCDFDSKSQESGAR